MESKQKQYFGDGNKKNKLFKLTRFCMESKQKECDKMCHRYTHKRTNMHTQTSWQHKQTNKETPTCKHTHTAGTMRRGKGHAPLPALSSDRRNAEHRHCTARYLCIIIRYCTFLCARVCGMHAARPAAACRWGRTAP